MHPDEQRVGGEGGEEVGEEVVERGGQHVGMDEAEVGHHADVFRLDPGVVIHLPTDGGERKVSEPWERAERDGPLAAVCCLKE